MRLTSHFSLHEFTRSQAASRLGVDNTPGPIEISNIVYLCEQVLEPVRNHFGPVRITSGYRCPAVNRAIGGSWTSQHRKGEAADFEVFDHDNLSVAYWCRDNLPIFDQLISEYYVDGDPSSGWIHISIKREGKNRREVLTKKHGMPYMRGLPTEEIQ